MDANNVEKNEKKQCKGLVLRCKNKTFELSKAYILEKRISFRLLTRQAKNVPPCCPGCSECMPIREQLFHDWKYLYDFIEYEEEPVTGKLYSANIVVDATDPLTGENDDWHVKIFPLPAEQQDRTEFQG